MARPKKAVATTAPQGAPTPARSPVTEPTTKKKRIPVGTRNILTVEGKDPNYVYRVVNIVGDRIPQFLDGGYEIVDGDDVRVGDRSVNRPSAEGSKAQVSVGGGDKAYVMRIRREDYEADQKAKQERIDALERSLQNPDGADYGKLSIDKTGARK